MTRRATLSEAGHPLVDVEAPGRPLDVLVFHADADRARLLLDL